MNSPRLAAEADDEVELAVVDVGVARAFWEGVPTARLLARTRLARDEDDLVEPVARATGAELDRSSWDTLQARLLKSAPALLERVKRAIARHGRAASDEGPLPASDETIAALVHALASASDPDASPAEGAAEAVPLDESVLGAFGELDERLGGAVFDRRAPPFEACLRLATLAAAPPVRYGDLRTALDAIGDTRPAVVGAGGSLYPAALDDREVPLVERRAALLERADLERALLRPERDRDAAIARAKSKHPTLAVEVIANEVVTALARRGGVLLFRVPRARTHRDDPSLPPSSWLPSDFGAPGAAKLLAGALERGATTVPRVRALVARGGETALDAIGREMLEVAEHPFASAVFAETIATAARERDVVRLVTYFAIAPDPAAAARVLSLSTAREVPTVLLAWLESMGNTDETRERLATCLRALEPYPELAAAVRPLVERISAQEDDGHR